MNLDIAATGPAPPRSTTPPATAERLDGGSEPLTADAASFESAVTVDTFPASPPPEVMDAIAVATQAADRLAADGQALHFQVDPPTGKVTIEVHDLQGNVQSTVSPSKALDIAGGGTLD
jgi:hypothetical protein